MVECLRLPETPYLGVHETGSRPACLKRVAADLERAAQAYRVKSNA